VASPAAMWEDVNAAFAPFTGTCLYAIRADAFFHFALEDSNHRRFVAKNLLYPFAFRWRSRHAPPNPGLAGLGEYWFISDYAAEPGFGSLRPLLLSCDAPATVVASSKVLAARSRELAGMLHVNVISADAYHALSLAEWRTLWQRSRADYASLLETSPRRLLPVFKASRFVLRTLLLRAYLYQRMYDALFAASKPRAVIMHNDFTSLSYLGLSAALRAGIPDFTLQHGFPSPEYFPGSASHYLVWGPAFAHFMQERGGVRTRYVAVGAPRLDATVLAAGKRHRARHKINTTGLSQDGKLNLLFLSQSHSPVFSKAEHHQILALVSALAQEPWLRLVVRAHPQESAKAWRRYAGLASAATVPAEVSLTESVLAADLILAVNSTAMLEAALLGAPVVQIALPEFCDRLGLLRFPRPVRDLASARAALRLLSDDRQRQALVVEQQTLLRAWVSEPGQGTAAAWRYIRAKTKSGATCAPPVAAWEEAR
jgi:hypothetical protein